jgi:hypothetical protein
MRKTIPLLFALATIFSVNASADDKSENAIQGCSPYPSCEVEHLATTAYQDFLTLILPARSVEPVLESVEPVLESVEPVLESDTDES